MSNERIDLTQFEKHTEDGLRGEDTVWRKDVNHEFTVPYVLGLIAELQRCYEEIDEYDKLVGLLIENHFVETSPYETVKHLIETHQDYKASE